MHSKMFSSLSLAKTDTSAMLGTEGGVIKTGRYPLAPPSSGILGSLISKTFGFEDLK